MALDKLVDSTQLDSDLSSVANAIRAKSGGSASLAFPAGFVSEIQAIPSGGGGPHEVPDGYTQLLYLEGTGTQWIKTDIAPTLEIKIQVTGQRTVTNAYSIIAGCKNPSTYIPVNSGAAGSTFYCKFGTLAENHVANPLPQGTFGPPTITVDKTQATFEAEGFPTGATKTLALGATALDTINPDTRVALFGRHDGSTDSAALTSGRIYRAKIWIDNVLVGDYVPAKRDADDVLGMYDLVSNTFYTNAGTGVFTGGEYE